MFVPSFLFRIDLFLRELNCLVSDLFVLDQLVFFSAIRQWSVPRAKPRISKMERMERESGD